MHEWSQIFYKSVVKNGLAYGWVQQSEAEAALAEARKEASYARQALSDRDERVEHLQAKLAEAQTREKRYIKAIDESNEIIADLRAQLAAAEAVRCKNCNVREELEADCKQYLGERNKYQTLYVEQKEEVARLKAQRCPHNAYKVCDGPRLPEPARPDAVAPQIKRLIDSQMPKRKRRRLE